MKTIIIQGAMPKEVEPYIEFLGDCKHTNIDGYDFYEKIVGGKKYVVSQTQIGIMNATSATVVGIKNFAPDLVINQGTAGAHINSLGVGEVIVATGTVYMNKFKTPTRFLGQGSNSLEWKVMSYDSNVFSTPQIVLEKAKQILKGQNVIYGILGCGDMFSRETDRINYLRTIFDEQCEDMESVAVYKVCQNYNVMPLGIRVISNNELVENTGSVSDNIEFCMEKIKKVVLDVAQNF